MTNVAAPQYERMERGTGALHTRLQKCNHIEIRQTLRGCLQEAICGCEARSEFRYYDNSTTNGQQLMIGHSLERSCCCIRMCYRHCYSWTMPIRDVTTNEEIMTVHRPCTCPIGPCKFCCYQKAIITSGGDYIGSVRENCYCFIPSFNTYNEREQHIYTIHPPTLCCGTCVNCCAEGCPWSLRACCRVPFWIFPASTAQWPGSTDGVMANTIGKIVKKRKSFFTEVFTDANAFDVHFPSNATTSDKAVLIGTSIFFNSLFFEDKGEAGGPDIAD
jgi:Scramblase